MLTYKLLHQKKFNLEVTISTNGEEPQLWLSETEQAPLLAQRHKALEIEI